MARTGGTVTTGRAHRRIEPTAAYRASASDRASEYQTLREEWERNGRPRQFDLIWDDGAGGIYEWEETTEEGEPVFFEVAYQEGSAVNNETESPDFYNVGWEFVNLKYDRLVVDPETLSIKYIPMPVR